MSRSEDDRHKAKMAKRKAAQDAEVAAKPILEKGLLIVDKLNIALRYDYLPLAEVVAALVQRRPGLHVVVTGRNAKPELIEAADRVTEFALVKHHFAAGVRAQEGVEF
jgi:cob(I)alamin adenosyltransferase